MIEKSKSDSKYRALFDNAAVGIVVGTIEGGMIEVNPALQRMLGYDADELRAMGPTAVTLPEDLERDVELFGELVRGERESYTIDKRYRRRDGSVFWGRLQVSLLPEADAHDGGAVIAMVEDITAERRAQETLERQSRLNEALAGLASSLIAEPTPIAEVARNVLAHAQKLTGAVHGFVSEVDPDNGDNVGHTLTDMMPNCSVGEPDRRIAFPRGEDGRYGGLWGLALNTGESFYTNSPSAHEASVGLPEGHVPLERFLAVPAVVGGSVVGEIALANPPAPFDDDDLEAVQQLARLYALAIARNRTDLALRDSEARFRSIVESSPFGLHMYRLHADGRLMFTGANPAADRILGVDNSQFVGMTVEAAFPPLADSEIPIEYRRVAREGGTWHTDQVQYEHGEIVGAYLVNAFQTSPGAMAAAFLDITAQQQAQHELEKSERRYRHLVETMSDGMGAIDAQGRITFVNRRLEEMLGYERDDLVGRHFAELFDGENLEQVKAGFDTRKTGLSEPYELTWKRRDGSELTSIMSPQPLFGDDGEFLGSIAVITDVTALKRAEERDREHARTMAFLAETAMGFVELTPERDIFDYVTAKLTEAIPGAIVIASDFDEKSRRFVVRSHRGVFDELPRVTELLGGTAEGMSIGVSEEVARLLGTGRLVRLEGGVHQATNGQIPQLAAKALEKLLGIRTIWTIGFTRSGVLFGTVTVITRESGAQVDRALVEAFVRQAAVALDRRRAEAEKDELEEQLFQAQKLDAIGTLAGGVAHDFNNILTGILGQSFLLKRNFQPGSALFESAEAIETMTLRASELTRQLLGFARKGKKRDIPVDLHSVVDDVLVVLGHTFDKRITVATRLTTDRAEVAGDPTQLQQVVLNLAVNARDAMPDGGKLVFETSMMRTDDMPHESYVVLHVSDTGMGIPSDVRSRIFEPFFSTKEPGQGTGMGLAVVYGIVQNHGGWIEVQSEEGEGTRFTVALPAVARKDARPVTVPPPELGRGVGRILVVDDEKVVRDVLEQVLAGQGFDVVCRENGQQALDYYREHGQTIDLVILDLMMPVMNGTTCFHRLREIDPEVKVMLATGHTLDALSRQLVVEGLAGFVEKPFMPSQLAKAVIDALNESS